MESVSVKDCQTTIVIQSPTYGTQKVVTFLASQEAIGFLASIPNIFVSATTRCACLSKLPCNKTTTEQVYSEKMDGRGFAVAVRTANFVENACTQSVRKFCYEMLSHNR